MPKERKPSVRQSGNPNPGFLLERRSRNSGGKTSATPTKTKQGYKKGEELLAESDIRPLGVDAFIEVLNRYCRRFLRDGKNFSLASLRILEYERVKSTAGNELADQLDRLGANIVCSALRGEDRICFVAPAQYLVLMPGTTYDDAHGAMQRAAQTIGEKSVRQKGHVVRPSVTFMVTSPLTAGGTSCDTDTLVATEILLGEVGFDLGTHNELIDRTLRDRTENGGACKVFTGSYDAWFERYKRVGEQLTDTWSPGTQNIILRLWEPSVDTDTGVNHETLLRRLRALQSIEHPAFNKVTDFFITSDWKVTLISPKTEGVELKGSTDKKAHKKLANSLSDVTDSTILNWAIQICNALIAAQAMSPPLVLSSFSKIKVTLSQKDRIVLSDFESEYLQTSVDELAAGDRKAPKKANGFMNELAQFLLELVELKDESRAGSSGKRKQNTAKGKSDEPLKEFRDLLSTIAVHQENGEKFSLYKLRSTLKSIQDSSA